MKNKLKSAAALLLLAAMMSSCLTAGAQGTAFTYQGRLNAGPIPANGVYDFTFTLHDAAVAGGSLGTFAIQPGVPVSNGVFAVLINTNNEFGSSAFNGARRWMEIGVRSNGVLGNFTLLAPRQELTPAPYAVFAMNASSLNGTLPVAQLSGTLANNQLPANLATNGGNITGAFTGNGANITNVNAATLGGISSAGFWKTNGNSGANPTNGAFIGTTDSFPLEFKVNGSRVLRLEHGFDFNIFSVAPNFIAGHPANSVSNSVHGAFVGGGGRDGSSISYYNEVRGNYGATLGGEGNLASGYAAVAMGSLSRASGACALAVGQWANARGTYSTALSGYNTADGTSSLAMGDHSYAGGNGSVAMGFSALVTNNGSFAWADSDADSLIPRSFGSHGRDTFNIRARGGVWLDDDASFPTDLYFGANARQMINLFNQQYGIGVQSSTTYFRSNSRFSWFRLGSHSDTQNDPGAGGSVLMTLTSGGLTVNGTFVSASDRNVKDDFQPVDSRAVLEKVVALPLSQWRYKSDEERSRHLGPMAQDFHAAFGLGPDDKHIATVDADGVALAAIQGLNEKLAEGSQKSEARMQKLEAENAELKQQLAQLKAMMEKLAPSK